MAETQQQATRTEPTVTQETTETQVAPTQDWQKSYTELEAKYKALEPKVSEYESTVNNIEEYLREDEVAAKRAQAWADARRQGKSFKDVVAALEKQSTEKTTVQPAQTVQPTFDEGKLLQSLMSKIEPILTPIQEKNADMEVERDKMEAQRANPWLTEEKWTEFEKRYEAKVTEKAKAYFSQKGPFLRNSDSEQAAKESMMKAHGEFSGFSTQELLRVFMAEDMEKFIADGKRADVTLPPGMVSKLKTGTNPALLTQLKQKYQSIRGNHKAVAELCEEYAPQLGMDEEAVWNLLST